MAAKLIILSRLLQQKNEEALRAASVTQHGTAFLHEMERIYLAACLPLLDTATTPTPPTAANVRTLFGMTGSSLTRAQLYDATLTLKDRLPFAIATAQYKRLLAAVAAAAAMAAGANLAALLTTGRSAAPPADVVSACAAEVEGLVGAGGSDEEASGPEGDGGSTSASTATRSTRAASPTEPERLVPPLPATARNGAGRVVYADASPADERSDAAAALGELRAALRAATPEPALLERLPVINRGRVLVDIRTADGDVARAFAGWLRRAAASSAAVAGMLADITVEGEVLLIGAQWIVPKVTEYERGFVAQQEFHTDVNVLGEVLAVALHVEGEPMNTLIDTHGTPMVQSPQLARAASSVFMFDTGAVHAGPGAVGIAGPYPRYLTSRVFFLLASPALDADRVAQHRAHNGLQRLPLAVAVDPAAAADPACAPQAPPPLAHAALARVERRLARQLAPAEERSLLAALMEALLPLPLPAGGGGSRLRLLTGRSFLRALEEPALAQLWASLLEVLRATEGLPTPTTTRLLEQLVAATGAVGGLGASAMFA